LKTRVLRSFGCKEIGSGSWRLPWTGRIYQSFQQLRQDYPEKAILALAVRGGKQCQWEVDMLSPGGSLGELLPHFQLRVFNNLQDLKKFLGSVNA